MRLILQLVLIAAVIAAIVFAVSAIVERFARPAAEAADRAHQPGGLFSQVAFTALVLVIGGVSLGLIGGD